MITRSMWSGRGAGLRPRQTALLAAVAALSALTVACGDGPLPPEPDPCTEATSIEVGDATNGTLTADDCIGAENRYRDGWSLRIAQDMTVRIALSSVQFDTWLELQDTRGSVVAYNDDAGGTLNSQLVLPLAAGEYRIIATSYAEMVTGPYQLSVAEAAECTSVGVVSVGETVHGTLSSDDCYWEYGSLVDNWDLSISAAQDVRIALQSDDFQEGVLVRDASGAILYGAAADGMDGGAWFDIRLEPGSYTILATAIADGMTGSYDLSVLDAPTCGPGSVIELDVETSGALTAEDCALMGYGVADSYVLELDAELSVDFVLKSADFPPVILVRDESGTEVAHGQEYTTTGTAAARAVLPVGTYEVLTTSYWTGATGEYRLTVSETSCTEPGQVQPGDTVAGTITDQDCLLGDNRFRDSWTLVLDADTTVQIDLTSSDFDAYLVLRDGNGTEIATDDDSGSGTNASIVQALAAGTYEVLASTWGPYQFGNYQLAVSETTASPTAASVSGSSKPSPAESAPAAAAEARQSARWWEERPFK